jgi:hypothetical protein
MFIEIHIEPKEILIEPPKEQHYNSDMIGDITTRFIKIKGKSMVEVRPECYDDRFNGRFNPDKKYDVVIHLRTDYLGEEGKKRLEIKEELK